MSAKTLVTLLCVGALAACAPVSQTRSGIPEASADRTENTRAKIHTELAAGYYARGQYAIALDELNIALESDSRYAPAYSILGLVRAELREDKQAEEAFRRAIALQPDLSEAQNNFGFFLCQRGRMDEGLSYFESALKNPLYATPERAEANAGECSLRKGDLAGAEAHFFRALKRVPNLAVALQGMADVDFRQGRYLAARSKLRQLGGAGELSAQALWIGLRVERIMGDKAAEASYDAQLRRRFPDAMQTQWLIMGQYDQLGGGL